MKQSNLTPCRFTFGDSAVFDGYTDGTTWNGFANVWVTPAVHDAVCEYFDPMDVDKTELPELGSDGYIPQATFRGFRKSDGKPIIRCERPNHVATPH